MMHLSDMRCTSNCRFLSSNMYMSGKQPIEVFGFNYLCTMFIALGNVKIFQKRTVEREYNIWQ